MSQTDATAFVALLCVIGLVLFPLARAWGRRLEGGSRDSELRREVDDLRARVAELEGAQIQMQELGDRVEFAERMLAQRTPPAQLPDARMPE